MEKWFQVHGGDPGWPFVLLILVIGVGAIILEGVALFFSFLIRWFAGG